MNVIVAPTMLLLGPALRGLISSRHGWRTSQIAGGISAFAVFIAGGLFGAGL